MAKFTVDQAVVTKTGCFGIPAGTKGVIIEVCWALETPGMDGNQGCYGVQFPEDLLPHFAEFGSVWNYYDTEIAPVEGVQ